MVPALHTALEAHSLLQCTHPRSFAPSLHSIGTCKPSLRGRLLHANPGDQGEASTSAPAQEQAKKKRFRSSWDAKDAGAAKDATADYLAELGRAEYNINVEHGQNVSHVDSLFTGGQMGLKSDIADGSLRGYEFRSLKHIVGDYYIAPRFLDAIAMHVTKNKLVDLGALGTDLRVPLILGVWGGKGQGKSFQTELAMKKLGIEPVIMSAGEMESEWAGTPARVIRERYRRAADIAKVRGKLSCLLINDIDAGIGVFANTQRTVNTQMVVGTLMNLADEPNVVSTGQTWRTQDRIQRVPIIVTGNDLSTLFAPLVRDGRMAKFYWQPTRTDLVSILHQMYRDDGMSMDDMGVLLDTFAAQPLDFYGALRAATYDGQIRAWIRDDVVGGDLADEDANMAELSRRLINREGLPTFKPEQLRLEALLAEGRRLAQEQEHVNRWRLSEEYMRNTGTQQSSLIGLSG